MMIRTGILGLLWWFFSKFLFRIEFCAKFRYFHVTNVEVVLYGTKLYQITIIINIVIQEKGIKD